MGHNDTTPFAQKVFEEASVAVALINGAGITMLATQLFEFGPKVRKLRWHKVVLYVEIRVVAAI